MELVSSVWHVVSASLVFLIGIIVCKIIAKPLHLKFKRVVVLYIWHTILCVVYLIYAINNVSDAVGYYTNSLSNDTYFDFGTAGVTLLTSIFSYYIGLSILGTFLVFNIFGSIGLLVFDASLRVATSNKAKNIRRLGTLIVFLPSVSFWSAAIGKDSLSFMAASLALWAALSLSRRIPLMVIAILVMLLVRPHMAGLIVISVGVAIALQRKVSIKQRAFIGGISLAGIALLVPFALNFSGAADAQDMTEYIQRRQGYNMEGGGGIDIASMSPPMQFFTYLFRPLPFEAHSLFSFAASLDNVVLLFLFIIGGREMIKRKKVNFPESRIFLWVYSSLSLVVLSLTTANLGISVRQKWMFAPMLIFLFLSAIGKPVQRSRSSAKTATWASTGYIKTGVRHNPSREP